VLRGRGPCRRHRDHRQRLQSAGHAVVRGVQPPEPDNRRGRQEPNGYQHEEHGTWFQAAAGPFHRRPSSQTGAQTPAVQRGQLRQQQDRHQRQLPQRTAHVHRGTDHRHAADQTERDIRDISQDQGKRLRHFGSFVFHKRRTQGAARLRVHCRPQRSAPV